MIQIAWKMAIFLLRKSVTITIEFNWKAVCQGIAVVAVGLLMEKIRACQIMHLWIKLKKFKSIWLWQIAMAPNY